MSKLYTENNSKYLQGNPSWHIQDSAWKASKIHSLLQKNKIKLKSIIEVGCGAGDVLFQLSLLQKDDTIKYNGYDIAKDLLPFWRERQKDNIRYYLDD